MKRYWFTRTSYRLKFAKILVLPYIAASNSVSTSFIYEVHLVVGIIKSLDAFRANILYFLAVGRLAMDYHTAQDHQEADSQLHFQITYW